MNSKVVTIWVIGIILSFGIGIFGAANQNLLQKVDPEKEPIVPSIKTDKKVKKCTYSDDAKAIAYQFTLANEGATLDDFLPIICYIIIQVKPKKMISNFANCQYFMSEKNKNQNMGYNLTNMHAFIAYINGIDHIKVGMENQEKEFNERCDKSLMEDKE